MPQQEEHSMVQSNVMRANSFLALAYIGFLKVLERDGGALVPVIEDACLVLSRR